MTPGEDRELDGCGSEPIAHPGLIQPHGALLLIEGPERRIRCASANVRRFLGAPVEVLLGTSLWGEQELPDGLHKLLAGRAGPAPATFCWHRQGLRVRVHAAGEQSLVELEPLAAADDDAANPELALALTRIQDAPDAASAIDEAVRALQALLGYDRVMAYRFDAAWNGQVIAERTAPGVTSFMGLCFPASDIPAQARALYAMQWLRMIPDVAYEPVALLSAGRAAADIDLSQAVLRSVSPVHIQYLKNMGVGASLSVSVRCEGALWGLLACHHTHARHASFDVVERCELLGRFLSAKLDVTRARERALASESAAARVSALLAVLPRAARFAEALAGVQRPLLELVGASGAAILQQGQLQLFGETPAQGEVLELMRWLAANSGGTEHAIGCLSQALPAARGYADRAAGALAVSLPDTSAAWLVWFRPERVHTVSWSGNPELSKSPEGSGARLGPRRSFELWKQTVQWTCAPWSEADLASAAALRRAAIERDLLAQLAREKAQSLELARSNRELDRYANVIVHDLVAPVRGIVAFSELLQQAVSRGELEQACARAATMRRSALALSELVRSLHEYSRAGRINQSVMQIDLSQLVGAELDRLAPFLVSEHARVEVAPGLPQLRCDRVRIGIVLSNLIINAVKYNRSADKRVRVFSRPGASATVCVQDNGIGLPAEQRERVFEMFVRLHLESEYGGGSGMGLAIARRIVELHGGRIWIEDAPDGGTTLVFTLGEVV